MNIIKPIKEKKMSEAYASLADVIRSYEPDRLDENTVQSLRFMLKHDTFAPIRDVIMDKLIEIGEYFARREEQIVKTNLEGKPINKPKRGPTRDNRKKKAQANAGNLPGEPALSMEFRIDKNTGLLMPVKR